MAALKDKYGNAWTVGSAWANGVDFKLLKNGIDSGGAGTKLWLENGLPMTCNSQGNKYRWDGSWTYVGECPPTKANPVEPVDAQNLTAGQTAGTQSLTTGIFDDVAVSVEKGKTQVFWLAGSIILAIVTIVYFITQPRRRRRR